MQVKGTSAPAPDLDYDVVSSLTFITNKTTYGPFGVVVGRQFQSSPQGKVMGFFGAHGRNVDNIGFLTVFSHPHNYVSSEGPWGGDGGDEFYDGIADRIVAIDVEHLNAIISLQVTYAHGIYGFSSSKHGGGGTDKGIVDKVT